MVGIDDFWALIHPAIAIFFVFPLIGMVVNFAWQTRQRRQQAAANGKSKIPPNVGPEHLKLGRWLSSAVVGLTLLGIAHPIFSKFLSDQTWTTQPLRVGFVILIYIATIGSLVILHNARPSLWRGIFASLTGMGLILVGCQPEVFRRGYEWYVSHYYIGMTAALLMIFSLAIVQDIYQDRKNRWRTAHVVLNSIALLLFISQAFTGTRDLLEIPLSWQYPYIEQLYINNCQTQTCTVQPAPPPADAQPAPQ
ncbi:MAG TPA: DUF4079 domain-containing protein [Chroococcidiopsis sp.]